MKRMIAYLIGIGSAIFLFAQQVLAATSNPERTQALYGVMDVQFAYGSGPYFQGSTLFEKAFYIIITPLTWIILVPVIFIIGLAVFLIKKRKNKNKSDVQKNIQNRRT